MITTILFDLDGTLLPMEQDVFVRAYFGELAPPAASIQSILTHSASAP